jgi:hypothetical protein
MMEEFAQVYHIHLFVFLTLYIWTILSTPPESLLQAVDSNTLHLAMEEWYDALDVNESGKLQTFASPPYFSLPCSNFVLQIHCRSLSFKLAWLLVRGAELNRHGMRF